MFQTLIQRWIPYLKKKLLKEIRKVFCFVRKDKHRTEQSPQKENRLIFHRILQSFQIVSDKAGTHLSSFPGKDGVTASLTIEASIALPLFLFMCFMMLYPLKIMDAERKLQNSMEKIGKSMAIMEYVETVGEKFLKKDETRKELISNMFSGLEEGGSLALILAEASAGPFENLHFSNSTAVFSKEENADAAMFTVELMYDLDMPFAGAFPIVPISKSLVVNRRAWVGSSGGRGRSKYGEDIAEETEDDRMVYLGKNSTVYHDDPKCHYLSNVTYMADVSAMIDLRTGDGGKYHACPSCKPGAAGNVYYFANGNAYHASEDCKAITAYVREVRFSEVEDMRACSYCGLKHAG